MKRAKGYTKQEIVEEYTLDRDGGEMILCKKKVSTKYIPPDVNAIKLLIFKQKKQAGIFDSFSDIELQNMRDELLLKMEKEDED